MDLGSGLAGLLANGIWNLVCGKLCVECGCWSFVLRVRMCIGSLESIGACFGRIDI